MLKQFSMKLCFCFHLHEILNPCRIWKTLILILLFREFELCSFCFSGHDDEILDVSFDYTGQYIVTGSADGSGRVYNATTHQCVCKLEGHDGEISKVYQRLICNVFSLASLKIIGCSGTSMFR